VSGGSVTFLVVHPQDLLGLVGGLPRKSDSNLTLASSVLVSEREQLLL
jgi:hypothetical protein